MRISGARTLLVDVILQRMTRDVCPDGGQVHGALVAATGIVCRDTPGTVAGRPFQELLGGRARERMRACAAAA